MPDTMDKCPLCGEPNPHTAPECRRCFFRLPWADSLEGLPPREIKRSDTEHAFDAYVKSWGLLPEHTVACRFCNEKIGIDDKQCPHCKKWLVAAFHEFEIDPWQPDYDDRAAKKTGIIGPRGGCVSVILFLGAVAFPILCLALSLLAGNRAAATAPIPNLAPQYVWGWTHESQGNSGC